MMDLKRWFKQIFHGKTKANEKQRQETSNHFVDPVTTRKVSTTTAAQKENVKKDTKDRTITKLNDTEVGQNETPVVDETKPYSKKLLKGTLVEKIKYIKATTKCVQGRLTQDEDDGGCIIVRAIEGSSKPWALQSRDNYKVVIEIDTGVKAKSVVKKEKIVTTSDKSNQDDNFHNVFIKHNELTVISWNTLKMKVAADGNLLFQGVIDGFAAMNPDVMVLQEVTDKEGKKRVNEFKVSLENCLKRNGEIESEFIPYFSDPFKGEVHAILIRKRGYLAVKGSTTLSKLIDKGTSLEYFTLSVHLVDSRLKNASKHILITSVHLPPKTRSKDRDLCFHMLMTGGLTAGMLKQCVQR